MLYTKKSSLQKFPPKYRPTSKSPHIKRPLQKVPTQNDLYKKSSIIKKDLFVQWIKKKLMNQTYRTKPNIPKLNIHQTLPKPYIYYLLYQGKTLFYQPPSTRAAQHGGVMGGGPYPMKGLSPHHSLSPPSTTTLKNDDMNNTDDLKIKMSSKRKASSKKKTPIKGRQLQKRRWHKKSLFLSKNNWSGQ